MTKQNAILATRFGGLAHETALFLEEEHLKDTARWEKFVNVFRLQPDGERNGWRGEYWGKMMRGAVTVYQYTKSESLYEALAQSVRDLFSVQAEDGRVSSYSREADVQAWDLWCRKYVMLGCEYFLEICKDEALRDETLAFLCRLADEILTKIGPGKKKITQATRNWLGLNSSSILEPMVRLHTLTGEARYLDFASYIVEIGGAEGINVFELALEGRLMPYQYGVAKAYEMISCFEGLLAYYKATGIEKYKTAVLNYAEALLDSEISIIGCCGVTHELLDHTKCRQTVRNSEQEVMQETCVTVTLMKFLAAVLELTGDSRFADVIEKSFYNAYLGALNVEHRHSGFPKKKHPELPLVATDLPFDSYSPLTPGLRGRIVGGYQMLSDYSYFGCCACIGAAGVGVFLKNAVVLREDGITLNFYERGTVELIYEGIKIALTVKTDYPADGKIRISVAAESPVAFTLRLRTPAWVGSNEGWKEYRRTWSQDTLEIDWPMPLSLHFPESWEEDCIWTDRSQSTPPYNVPGPIKVYHKPEDDRFVAVTRGPLTLAADSRTGKDAASEFSLPVRAERIEGDIAPGVPCLVKMEVEGEDGEKYILVDYAHAGRDWETKIAAWLPTKE